MTPFFRYKDLDGSPWKRRFIAEEYTLRLNGTPDRFCIEDSELSCNIPPEKLESYRAEIVRLMLDSPRLEGLSPWELLDELRELKYGIFGNGHIRIQPLAAEPEGSVFEWLGKEAVPEPAEKTLYIGTSRKAWLGGFRRWVPRCSDGVLAVFSDRKERGIRPDEAEELCKTGGEAEGSRIITFGRVPLSAEECSFVSSWAAAGGRTVFSGLKAFAMADGLVASGVLESCIVEIAAEDWLSSALLGRYRGMYLGPVSEKDFHKTAVIGALSNGGTSGPAALMNICAGILDRPFPKVVVTGTEFTPLNIADHLSGAEERSLGAELEKSRSFLCESFPGTDVYNGFYNLRDRDLTAASGCGDIILSGMVFNAKNVRPVFLERQAVPPGMPENKRGLVCSFNYYFTETLRHLYNAETPAAQQLHEPNLQLDFLGVYGNGCRFESLPLFGKAFLGCTAGGRLFAGHYPLASAVLSTSRGRLVFGPDNINPGEPSGGADLYLPSYGADTAGSGCDCLVFAQGRLLCRMKGPCRIPPFGWLAAAPYGMIPDTGGFSWEAELGGLPAEKAELAWLAGGLNMLYSDGKNHYGSEEDGIRSLRKEGWLYPSSIASQETQLEPGVRQPRCAIGRTLSGRTILFTVSGRTRASRGAVFGELVDIAEAMAGNDGLDFLVNLDGGASAGITAFCRGRSAVLGLPAPSPDNAAGMIRPVPAYLAIEI